MSKQIDDGGSAFPTAPVNHGYDPSMGGYGTGSGPGLSLRDYFAATALNGVLSHSYCDPSSGTALNNSTPENNARFAYRIADAMLAARQPA